MELRKYQTQAIEQLRIAYQRQYRSLLLEAPTGAGKTVIFSQICKNANQRGKRVLIVTDRLNLNDQTAEKLEAVGAGELTDVLTVQTAIRRVSSLPYYDIIIVDEAHKKTFDNFIKKMRVQHGPGFLLLGFTATPMRTGKTGALCEIYERIVSVTTIKDLISLGYLVPAITYGAPFDMGGVKMKGGDYDNAEMFQRFDETVLYNDVVNRYKTHAPGKKAICFCINVEHSKRTAQAFKAAGVRAAHLDGTAPPHERARVLSEFKTGRIEVLCNCDLYTTGFDEPSIQAVILNRATRSVPLFLQMCGRGSRPYTNKTKFIIIDMGNNVFTCGFWQQERVFSLEPVKPAKPGIAPVKDCKNCGAIIPASATVCPHCGAVQPEKKKKVKIAGAFIELDPGILERDPNEMTFNELEMYRKIKRNKEGKPYKFGWMVRVLIDRGDLEAFAAARNYSAGWIKKMNELYNN